MTAVELRMFFEALPQEEYQHNQLPTRKAFARECDIQASNLKKILEGSAPLTESVVAKLLPVMQKYGYQGLI